MAPTSWKDDPEQFAALFSELTNSLQACLGLSAVVRRNAEQNTDDALNLEGQIERAVRAVPDVGRVHIHRWSDLSAHLHLWFMARPSRRLEARVRSIHPLSGSANGIPLPTSPGPVGHTSANAARARSASGSW